MDVELNKEIPLTTIIKYIVKERDKWKKLYAFAKDRCITLENTSKGLSKQLSRYQQARNVEGKFISQEQYNSVRKRNKELTLELSKLKKIHNEVIAKYTINNK